MGAARSTTILSACRTTDDVLLRGCSFYICCAGSGAGSACSSGRGRAKSLIEVVLSTSVSTNIFILHCGPSSAIPDQWGRVWLFGYTNSKIQRCGDVRVEMSCKTIADRRMDAMPSLAAHDCRRSESSWPPRLIVITFPRPRRARSSDTVYFDKLSTCL